jgi:hypothetical protein
VEALEGRLCPGLTLTQQGQAAGIVLSTFAVDFPSNSNIGPLGIVFPNGGGVLVTDYPSNVRRFPTDTDGQSTSRVTPGGSYGTGRTARLAQVGDAICMTAGVGSPQGVYQIDADGRNPPFIVGVPGATGIVANPTNGHLYVSESTGGGRDIVEVDPIAGRASLFVNAGGYIDGCRYAGADAGEDLLLGGATSLPPWP